VENTSPQPEGLLSIVRAHWVAVLVAVVFGILLAGPFILVATNESFTGVYPELANDQNFYLSRIQDVRDGFPMSGNTYIAEDKEVPPMNFLTGEFVEAKILDLFGLPTHASLILFPLLFGPIIFLLTYAIYISLGASRFWGLIGTLWLIGPAFFEFARPVSPQFNFIFWLIAALVMIWFVKNRTWLWAGGVAVSVGVLFYLYPYYWTHLFAAYGLLFLWLLFKDRATAIKVFAAGVGATLIGIPYGMLALSVRTLPEFEESMSRLGFVETHMPSGILMLLGSGFLLAVIMFIAYRLKKADAALTASVVLLFGALIAMNQHVITGINMEFSSHYKMQIAFSNLFLACAALSCFSFWHRLESARVKSVAFILILLVFIPAVASAYIYAEKQLGEGALHREHGMLVSWLTENARPGESVYAPELVAIFIPAYTAQNVFYGRNANIAFMPDTEVIDRFIVQNFRADLTPEYIAEHEREVLGHGSINANSHALQKQKLLGLFGIEVDVPKRVPDDAIARIKERGEAVRSMPFVKALLPYKVDYFILERGKENQITPEDIAFAKPVFETEHFILYSL